MVKFSDCFDPFVFFVALFLGFLIVYIIKPTPDIIIKYPTPFNTKFITYKDKVGNCFKYTPKKVKCPNEPSKFIKVSIEQ